MNDDELTALVVRIIRGVRDQEDSTTTEATPTPTQGAHMVAFHDPDTEATAQRVYTYMRNNPGVTSKGIIKALALPTHWFRNPKVLANGKSIVPGVLVMRERAGQVAGDVPTATPATSTPAKPETTPEQVYALRAVAIRVASHLEHALDDGLAGGLLFEKAKSTSTLRNLAATVRTRGGV